MPNVINGIGTWYYGQSNVCEHSAVCEHCQKEGVMRSYDTTLFFVFIFIPLFPIKKVRVLYECPHCKRHRFLPLRDWNEGKRKELDKARMELREAFAAETVDNDKVKQIIGTFVSYEDADELQTILPTIKKNCSGNADIMTHLGCAYAAFNRFTDAERIFKESLKIEENTDTREILADILIKRGKPSEAAEYLAHITADEIPDRIGCLVQLAEAYQALGEHDRALKVLDDCVMIVPALEHEKWLKDFRKLSEKNLKSRKKINNGVIPRFSEGKTSGKSTLIPYLTGPAILCIILFVYFGFSIYLGTSRSVYLVNGLNKPYSVEVNGSGEQIKLSPFARRKIKLPEGSFDVKVSGLPIASAKGSFSTNFFLRPFLYPVFVINPDRAAIMVKSTITYAKDPKFSDPPVNRFFAGSDFYQISGLDYVFEEFPKSLRAKEGSVLRRTGLFLNSPQFFNELDVYQWYDLENSVGKEKAIAVASNVLRAVPDNFTVLSYLFSHQEPKSFVELVKPSLAIKPAIINNHRFYQEMMTKLGKYDDLIEEYRQRKEKNPDDAAYKYLLGRLVKDRSEALTLFKAGAEGPKPCPFSLHALAFDAFTTGNFKSAVRYWKKAVARDPDNKIFNEYYQQALLASRSYRDLLKITNESLKKNPMDLPSVIKAIQIHYLSTNEKAATAFIDKTIERLKSKYPDGQMEKVRPLLSSFLLYMKGDLKGYCSSLDQFKSASSQFSKAVIQNNLQQAEKAYAALEKPELKHALLMSIMACDARKPELAKKYIGDVVKFLREGKADEQLMADYLTGSKQPEFDKIEIAGLNYDVKPALLVLLAEQCPQVASRCKSLAGTLNYSRTFPYHFVKKHIGR